MGRHRSTICRYCHTGGYLDVSGAHSACLREYQRAKDRERRGADPVRCLIKSGDERCIKHPERPVDPKSKKGHCAECRADEGRIRLREWRKRNGRKAAVPRTASATRPVVPPAARPAPKLPQLDNRPLSMAEILSSGVAVTRVPGISREKYFHD